MRRAVFLDRDGVINRVLLHDGRPCPPRSTAEFEILPGVSDACVRLRGHGFLLIVVTNQPEVARGTQRRQKIEAIHERLRDLLDLDDIRVCYHDDQDNCECRKPKPGLLLAAADEWNVDLRLSFMVGDRWRDMEAGRAAGCRTVFVNGNYNERRPDCVDFETGSLSSAADWILSRSCLQRLWYVRR